MKTVSFRRQCRNLARQSRRLALQGDDNRLLRQAIAQKLSDILQLSNDHLSETITQFFVDNPLTPEQQNIIEKAASPSLMRMGQIAEQETGDAWPKRIAHAFSDSARNKMIVIKQKKSIDPDQCEQTMFDLTRHLKQNIHNYRLIMGDEMPPLIKQIIDDIETYVIPGLDLYLEPVLEDTPNKTFHENDNAQQIGLIDPDVWAAALS